MTTQTEQTPRRRAWWLWLGLGVLLLVVMWASFWWWFVLKPAYDERRPFVGTWRMESPVFPARPELVVEVDLMIDGTKIDRVWDPKTGAVAVNQPSPGRWRVVNGRFQEVMGGNPVVRWLEGSGAQMGWDHPVTWEGPDRFRLQGTSAGRRTMIWSRCESRTGLPLTHLAIGPE
jgi:hypothetical protein